MRILNALTTAMIKNAAEVAGIHDEIIAIDSGLHTAKVTFVDQNSCRYSVFMQQVSDLHALVNAATVEHAMAELVK